MQARDVMVSPVITVRESATVREIAKILLEKRISAVPVVDNVGKLVGIVTESDLMRRAEAGTEHPYSWWVHFLAGDATIAADYVKSHATKIEDVMTSDVVTANPETPLHEIATLLEEHQIKRVPIVDKVGNLVGIVSRANLIQVVASARPTLEMTLPDSTIRQKLLDELKRQPWAHTHNLGSDGYERSCRPLGVMLYPMKSGKRSAWRQKTFRESLPSTITSRTPRYLPTDPE